MTALLSTATTYVLTPNGMPHQASRTFSRYAFKQFIISHWRKRHLSPLASIQDKPLLKLFSWKGVWPAKCIAAVPTGVDSRGNGWQGTHYSSMNLGRFLCRWRPGCHGTSYPGAEHPPSTLKQRIFPLMREQSLPNRVPLIDWSPKLPRVSLLGAQRLWLQGREGGDACRISSTTTKIVKNTFLQLLKPKKKKKSKESSKF